MMFSLGLTFVIKTNKQTKPPPQQQTKKKTKTKQVYIHKIFQKFFKIF